MSSETLFVQQNEMFAKQHFRTLSLNQTSCQNGDKKEKEDITLFLKTWVVGLSGIILEQKDVALKSEVLFFFKDTVSDLTACFLR